MTTLFYISAAVAVFSTFMVVVRANIVHALLYLLVSLLSTAMVFYLLGAAYAAMMEIIIYAGAILILFVFVIMMVNVSRGFIEQEKRWIHPGVWPGPALLGAVLFGELVFVLLRGPAGPAGGQSVEPSAVGVAMFGPYMIAVELISMVLMSGLVGAYHLARRRDMATPSEETHE